MKRTDGWIALWLQLLLLVSIEGSQGIKGRIHAVIPKGGNHQDTIPNLIEDLRESVISSGILWKLSPSESSSSSSSKVVPPKVNCIKSGFFPVAGSCKDFYYCQEMTDKELVWSVFWFTCPPGKIFDDNSKMCSPLLPLVTSRPECQTKEEEFTDALTDNDNEVLVLEESSEQGTADDDISEDIQIQNRKKRMATIEDTTDERNDGQGKNNGFRHMIIREWSLLGSILNRPHYPGRTFSSFEVVPPEVNCIESGGVFAKAGSCKDFYYCNDIIDGKLDGSVFWSTCPPGKIFDDDSKMCRHPSLVTSRPECQTEEFIHGLTDNDKEVLLPEESSDLDAAGGDNSRDIQMQNRKKQSATIIDASDGSTGKKVIDIIVDSVNETCVDVHNIDAYVKHINSKQPVDIPSFEEEVYKNILKEYNKNLGGAKKNCISWRNENSILESLRETFLLTEEFEPKFKQRFSLIKKNVKTILRKEKLDIQKIKEDLREVKEEVSETEDALNATINTKENAYIRDYLKTTIQRKQKEMKRLVKLHDEAEAEFEFQKLVELLEYVKSNAIEIQDKAENTRLKMGTFQENIAKDSSAFNRSHKIAEAGIKNIKEQQEHNNREKARINAETARLRIIVRTENSKISILRNRAEASKRDLIHELERLQRDLELAEKEWQRDREAAEKARKIGSWLFVIPVAGWIAGGALLDIALSDIRSERTNIISAKQRLVDNYYNELRVKESQISSIDREIDSAISRIETLQIKDHKLREELQYFGRLNTNLKGLQDDVDSILPFITKAIVSIGRMKDVFRGAEQDLEEVIFQAGTAKTNAHKRIFRYFMYYETDKLKEHWHNAKEKIASLGQCVPI